MGVVTVPPFERFYEQHKGIVLGMLAKRLGRERAEDAFQETFFRALRAYPKLRDGRNLRAWPVRPDPLATSLNNCRSNT